MIHSNFWILCLVTALLFNLVIAADDEPWDKYKCDAKTKCPSKRPCCSQYGVCGTGAYCLGGCDIRYSYNLTSCMPMPIMEEYKATFDNTSIFTHSEDYLGKSDETDWIYTGYIDTADDALLLQMPNGTTGTVVSSTKYLWYGKLTAKMKSSRDRGVITAFILYSDVKDEIDHESVGYDLTHPQSNYYAHGILNYDQQGNVSASDTFENYHDYGVDWTEDKVDWLLDGKVIRTLKREDTWNETTERYDFPQTPSRIQFSLWPGGYASNAIGTIEWAGGEVDWNSQDIQDYGYYYAFVKEITVEPYDHPDVEEIEDEDGEDDFTAFLFNSTDANAENVFITNKKTWLGSQDATGLDPDNEEDDEETHTETYYETSGSTTHARTRVSTSTNTNTSSRTGGANVPAAAGEDTPQTTYNPSAGIGGFVQDSQATASAGSSSGSGGSSSSGNRVQSFSLGGIISFAAFIVVGVFWI